MGLFDIFSSASADEKAFQRAQKSLDALCNYFDKDGQSDKNKLDIIKEITALVTQQVNYNSVDLGKKALAFFHRKMLEKQNQSPVVKLSLISNGFTAIIRSPNSDTLVKRDSLEYMEAMLNNKVSFDTGIRTPILTKIIEIFHEGIIPVSENTMKPYYKMAGMESSASPIKQKLVDLCKWSSQQLIKPEVHKPVSLTTSASTIEVHEDHDIDFVLRKMEDESTPQTKGAYTEILGESLVSGKLKGRKAADGLGIGEIGGWPLEDSVFTALCKMATNTIPRYKDAQELAGHYVCTFIEKKGVPLTHQEYTTLTQMKKHTPDQEKRVKSIIDLLGSSRNSQVSEVDQARLQNGGYTWGDKNNKGPK